MNNSHHLKKEFSWLTGKNLLLVLQFVVLVLLMGFLLQGGKVVSGEEDSANILSIEYLHDKSNALDIEEVVGASFDEVIPTQFALGYKAGAAWFKITIDNAGPDERFVIYFTEPFWITFDLYEQDGNQWRVSKNGLEVPINARDIPDADPVFPLTIPSGATSEIYVRGATASSHIGEFKLLTQEEYYRPDRISVSRIYTLYNGVLIFMMLFVGFLYAVMREVIYLYYIGYAASFIAWLSVQNGNYLYLGVPGWGGGLHAIGTLVVAFLVLFSKNLLNLKEKAPLTNKAFEYFAVLFFACGMAISLGVPYVNLFFNIASSIFFTLLLVTAIRAWRNRYFANARFYLIALMIYMPSMGVMTLTYNAVLPNTDFFRYAFLPGSLVEILFFSFVLISRYHYANKEKIFMQNELMREKDRYSSDLEAKVEERTRELARINQQLMRQTEELNETKKQLTIDAATDVLSGLYNRRYFLERFTSLFADAKSLKYAISVVMIDVDHFKSINDRHGHQVGDDAIKACADILKEYARNTDVVARYGGEEFTILMPHSTLDDALLLAERIRSQVERQSINIDDKVILRLTLSIGVTQIDLAQDESVDDILQRVDRALYEAKDGGRNKVVGL